MSIGLIDVVEALGHPRVIVVGDLILDRYLWADAERISQEAPVLLLREERQELRLGGAANVCNMLRGLEAEVYAIGVVGADRDGDELCAELRRAGVTCDAVAFDPSRPTTVKQRVLGRAQHRHPHQVVRIDRETRRPLDEAIEERLLRAFDHALDDADAILVSDYAKGVCTPGLLRHVIGSAARRGIPVIVDPAARADYRHYRGATAVTPNRSETAEAVGFAIDSPDTAARAATLLLERFALQHAFVTIDAEGIVVASASDARTPVHCPTRPRAVYDITGAGDMVLATIGLGFAAGLPVEAIARLANVTGGLEVEQVGVVCLSRRQIVEDILRSQRSTDGKICSIEQLERHVAARRSLGHRIVMTNGCFDLLHAGHVTYLQQARDLGDCLVVAINSDASIRRLGKGPDRPLFHQTHRATMLAALEAVDYVTIFEDVTPVRLIERLRPDILVKGGTYTAEQIIGREIVEAYGGTVRALDVLPGLSTTTIVERLRTAAAEPQPGPIIPWEHVQRTAVAAHAPAPSPAKPKPDPAAPDATGVDDAPRRRAG